MTDDDVTTTDVDVDVDSHDENDSEHDDRWLRTRAPTRRHFLLLALDVDDDEEQPIFCLDERER